MQNILRHFFSSVYFLYFCDILFEIKNILIKKYTIVKNVALFKNKKNIVLFLKKVVLFLKKVLTKKIKDVKIRYSLIKIGNKKSIN